jgi:hypothetical protein
MKPLLLGGLAITAAMSMGSCATSAARVAPSRQTTLVIAPLQRILVAGFVTTDSTSLDVNGETVRLLRSELRRQGALGVIETDPLIVSTEAELSNTARWRQVGEEYGHPMIVTGSMHLEHAPPNVFQRGSRGGVYTIQRGFLLDARIVLIDGMTGQAVRSERLPHTAKYGGGRQGSPIFLYHSIMSSIMPDLVAVIFGAHGD